MTESGNIRDIIRKEFLFMISEHGFEEDLECTTDNIYSEVIYKKNNWKISILTTAHETKISLSLVSPTNDFGFLHYYFNKLDGEYYKLANETNDLVSNVKFNSTFMKLKGLDILEGKQCRLIEIFQLIKHEHNDWITPFIQRQSDN